MSNLSLSFSFYFWWINSSQSVTLTNSLSQEVYVMPTGSNGLADINYLPWYGNRSGGWIVVPVMTSDTTPSGTCNQSNYGVYGGYDHLAWRAFDDDNSNDWWSGATYNTNQWLSYGFTNAVAVQGFFLLPSNAGTADCRVKNYKLQASNDNSTWVDLYTGQYQSTNEDGETIEFINTSQYLYYRFFIEDHYGSSGISIIELQLYGV